MNVQDFFQKLPDWFSPEEAGNTDAVIQFHLSGTEASDWVVIIHDKKLKVEKGTTENPAITLSADSQDLMDVVAGKMNPTKAFMQGKVQIKGNMGLAMKLVNLLQPKQ